jgi:hypothetical protein
MEKEKEINVEELTLTIPNSIKELTINDVKVFNKLMKVENLSDLERTAQLIAHFNKINIEEVRAFPIEVFNKVANVVIPLFTDLPKEKINIEDYRIIEIDGIKYGLEPNFKTIETGAYIDLVDLLSDVENNIEKIMAVLYREVTKQNNILYNTKPYSTESDTSLELREKIFLDKMSYVVVRAVVNFTLRAIMK